jgi:hypothetical protein
MNELNALVQIEHISQIRGRKNQQCLRNLVAGTVMRVQVKRQLASAGFGAALLERSDGPDY